MSTFKSKEFKRLKDNWYSKLKETGFIDHEDKKGNIIHKDVRTIAYRNKDKLSEFYYYLSHYITSRAESLRPREHKVLLLWSFGNNNRKIAKLMKNHSDREVKKIIYRHKPIVIAFLHSIQTEDID